MTGVRRSPMAHVLINDRLSRSPAAATRRWDSCAFRQAYAASIASGRFLENTDYYRRYRARYEETLKYVCQMNLPRPCRLLDVGGGQFGILVKALWGDHVTVLDVSPKYADYLEHLQIDLVVCDLVHETPCVDELFDLIVFAEVIEHLPIAPYVVLKRLRNLLSPQGYLLVTTPNLHRLRNIARMIAARDFTTMFRYSPAGQALGHIMEYSALPSPP
jgi:2-polyprenyl-3-methyl-5-hydroxy-6-metoxy-1,4-benzoquinol methylase